MPGSYNRAWEILIKLYYNERVIINANLKRLIELPILKTESADALKAMLDTTNECLAAINSYKIDTANWYPIIIFLLTQRLDSNSIKHWEEKIQGQKTIPKLDAFFDFLEMRINILETSVTIQPCTSYVKPHGNAKTKQVFLNTGKWIKCKICSQQMIGNR